MLTRFSLSNVTLVTPTEVIPDSSIMIDNIKISAFGRKTASDFAALEPRFVYPALINIHDHLRGDYLPRVGPRRGRFYLNWSYWDNDLKSSKVYKERSNISAEDCYFLGAYKNLFSGVITVNDHFPHEMNSEFIPKLPVRVVTEYTLAHECSSFDLKWGDGIEIEFKRAREKNYPFITHLEEGFDKESQDGIFILENLGCLDDHDVLVHCIGFSDKDILLAKEKDVHIAWCPASNIFMFNVTCKIRKILQAGINVSIGTDSTHTGSINLLEEMRYGRRVYRSMYGEDLSARLITEMVTINPAKAFRKDNLIGSLKEGKLADILVIMPKDSDPYEALIKTNIEDIVLLLQEGTPIYGSPDYEELFKLRNADYSKVVVRGRQKLVKGDPAGLLARVREAVGFKKELDYMPIDNIP
ncbi:MAG: amidohydrolase family protein [Spirochaetota bacterium]